MKNATITTKAYMEHNPDENLSWCKPISFLGGRIVVADSEVGIVGIRIDGKDIDMDAHEGYRARYSDAILERVARMVNGYYDLYSGYDNEHIIMQADHEELGCASCPWFGLCDAMSEEMQIFGDECEDYAEDEIIDVHDEED